MTGLTTKHVDRQVWTVAGKPRRGRMRDVGNGDVPVRFRPKQAWAVLSALNATLDGVDDAQRVRTFGTAAQVRAAVAAQKVLTTALTRAGYFPSIS